MKPKKLKNLINRTRSALRWRIIEQTHNQDTIEIVSDRTERTHTILTPANPSPQNPLRDIEYLHELAHATLCETVHPVFSTHYFAADTPAEDIRTLTPIVRAASDWFADQWLMEHCPELERAEIEEHYELAMAALRRASGPVEAEVLYGTALMIAQGIKYLSKLNNTGGQLRDVVNAFLSVRTEKPTAKKMEFLINSLASPYTNLRVILGSSANWHIRR
ncbi:MAG: hypothetical protein EHM79_02285 [Geobacter sp.]|nr:MAG: hypothetical protein EHM79_02285 [Geobacter sp.]